MAIKLTMKLPVRAPSVPLGPLGPLGLFKFPVPTTASPGLAWLSIGASRPRYFDGRFLAARDLDRDQRYFIARQTEHFRAAGAGVLNGLLVTAPDTSSLAVSPGIGFTPAGSLIALRDRAAAPAHDLALTLPLFDQGDTQRLDEAFGLLSTPRDIAIRRTGIFVLLARPVELTADPVGLYPASIDARRTPEDGDTIEAVAFTLAPYHDTSVDVDPKRQRAALARHLFVDPPASGLPSDSLPLAIVRLDAGFVTWCDAWLVRRELGAAHGGIGAYARAPRAVAEAQVQQYHAQLADIAAARAAAGKPAAYSASEELAALPPVGAFPIAALDLAGMAEKFFPQPMPVSLAVIPDDELAVILDEQLALPPIDLAAAAEQLATTPMTVLLTAPRATVESLPAELRGFPLRSSAVAPGRAGARSAVAIASIALRFAPIAVADDRGTRLAAALGSLGAAYFVRVRRATSADDGSIATIDKVTVS